VQDLSWYELIVYGSYKPLIHNFHPRTCPSNINAPPDQWDVQDDDAFSNEIGG